jgi:hypothetical protein
MLKTRVFTSVSNTNRLAGEIALPAPAPAQPGGLVCLGRGGLRQGAPDNKPIFLSIGYSTCHWCHVMERESFENPEIAAYLNAHFVSIKVDREERRTWIRST